MHPVHGAQFCPLLPALQRHQEVLLGRTAMVGLFMACLWEVRISVSPTHGMAGFLIGYLWELQIVLRHSS